MDKIKNSRNILEDMGDHSETTKALLAFAESQHNVAEQLKLIAENTNKLVSYFYAKNGFEEAITEKLQHTVDSIESTMDIKENRLFLKLAGLYGTLVALVGSVFYWMDHSILAEVKTLVEQILNQ